MDVRKAGDVSAPAQDASAAARLAAQLAGLIGHDLRNPLAAVEMGVQLLQRGTPSPVQARVLEHLASANGRAQAMLADLLDLVAGELGQGIAVSPSAVQLHALVAEGLAEAQVQAPDRIIEHDRIGQGDCCADAGRLAQLVGHLLANALAHGASDRPVIVASIVEPGRFRIVVHNEGPPIPPELQPALFEPRAHGRATPSGRSIGLGLYLVRRIAQAHGGDASLRSDASGTTVTASFRRDGESDSDGPSQA